MQLKSSLPLLLYLFFGLYILGCRSNRRRRKCKWRGETSTNPNPPSQFPRSMSFTDQDLDAGEIAGVVTVVPPLNESEITSYLLYWGKDEPDFSK